MLPERVSLPDGAAVEAIDFRAMGTFDTRILHLQFLLFLVAAVGALGALLRDRAEGEQSARIQHKLRLWHGCFHDLH